MRREEKIALIVSGPDPSDTAITRALRRSIDVEVIRIFLTLRHRDNKSFEAVIKITLDISLIRPSDTAITRALRRYLF